MHPYKMAPTLPDSRTHSRHSSKAVTLLAGLLWATSSAQLYAAPSNYRITEGHTHSEDNLGSDLPPSLDLAALTTLSKTTPSDDNHLTLRPEHALWFNNGIWIADIGTLLYLDDDQDGYFSGFSLNIDADTDYAHADVYAAIDIQRTEGERERLHTTGTFSIYGNSLSDEYRVDIELVRNYPIGDYDLFVSLIDANNHAVVDNLGPSELTNMSRLPLESEDYDNSPAYYEPQPPIQPSAINADIRAVEYSGANSVWLLLALGIPTLSRRRNKTHLST